MGKRNNAEKITILYLTDNVLEPILAVKCREFLLKAAQGKRIVSVSKEPLDFGDNICVGPLPRVALSMDVQIKVGLKEITTPFVAIAEHDCIYSSEHFDFIPSSDNNFWYNDNNWFVQYRHGHKPFYNGMYSYAPRRRVQSQLTAGRERFLDATEEKIAILSDSRWRGKYPRGRIGEPGTVNPEKAEKLAKHESVRHLWNQIREYICNYNAKDWYSKIPNLDIRHGDNFSGQRRGTNRTWNLPPWGPFYDLLGVPGPLGRDGNYIPCPHIAKHLTDG